MPFVVITTFSTGLVDIKVSSVSVEETSTPTRPVENVVITTKGLQLSQKQQLLDGRTVENKGKLILTEERKPFSYL